MKPVYIKRLIILAVFIALAVGFGMKQQKNMEQIQSGIASEIIRFHVRANSDSSEDQELKLKVRDSVIQYIEPVLAESESIDMSREILTAHMDDIKKTALETISANGSNYDVNVYFENSFFPMKNYGDVTFPPGVYEAFRIDIGESVGKNWWCVLYPPLCFVDATHGALPDDSKSTLKNILTKDEYNAVTGSGYKIEFKYLTFLNKFFKLYK